MRSRWFKAGIGADWTGVVEVVPHRSGDPHFASYYHHAQWPHRSSTPYEVELSHLNGFLTGHNGGWHEISEDFDLLQVAEGL